MPFGDFFLTKLANIFHTRSLTVNQYIGHFQHPYYDPDDNWRNDIAILKFDPIPSGQYIEPIAMVTDPNEDLTTMTCWTAGWGKTSGGYLYII